MSNPLTSKGLNILSFDDLDDYQVVKQHLLKEFKLTPREYRSKFIDAKKTVEETYTMFTARLKNLLNYYVKSRKVDKNFEKLFDLLVADKLKDHYHQVHYSLCCRKKELIVTKLVLWQT